MNNKINIVKSRAFKEYHNYPPFLDLIKKKFGEEAAKNIVQMTKIDLKRKIFGH